MSRSRGASSASAALPNSAQSVRGKIELFDGSDIALVRFEAVYKTKTIK
jgi:hypothetical protein